MYAHAGENLAVHFTDSSEVVDAWMDSPSHRANIVNAQYAEIGVGTARGTFEGFETVFVVQLFGTPAAGYATPIAPTVVVPVTSANESAVAASGELDALQAQLDELLALVDTLESNETTDAPDAQEAASELVQEAVGESVAEEVAVAPVADVLAENLEPAPLFLNDNTATVVADPAETAVLADVEEVIEEAVETVGEVIVSQNDIADEVVVSTEHQTEMATTSDEDVLVIESSIATSSGLLVGSVSNMPITQSGNMFGSVITQPNDLLQTIYLVLGSVVMMLLLFSVFFEARKLHFTQVAYSFGLMISMGALWYVHALLTAGAVII